MLFHVAPAAATPMLLHATTTPILLPAFVKMGRGQYRPAADNQFSLPHLFNRELNDEEEALVETGSAVCPLLSLPADEIGTTTPVVHPLAK